MSDDLPTIRTNPLGSPEPAESEVPAVSPPPQEGENTAGQRIPDDSPSAASSPLYTTPDSSFPVTEAASTTGLNPINPELGEQAPLTNLPQHDGFFYGTNPDLLAEFPFLSEELPEDTADPLSGVPDLGEDPDLGENDDSTEQCKRCGGKVGADGYCLACGAEFNSREHVIADGRTWFGGVSDRGLVHSKNEDSLAVSGRAEPGSFASLVVCDGVSMSSRSDVASRAAAEAALEALEEQGETNPETAMGQAIDAANRAVSALILPDEAYPPSCTFVAAIVLENEAWITSLGDSRAYWIPDAGEALRITTDDSLATYAISTGMSPQEAESSPGAHTLTAWIGPDSPLTRSDIYHLSVKQPGWLLLCSDGLWNYASAPQELADVIRETSSKLLSRKNSEEAHQNGGEGATAQVNPTKLASDLVDWANAQGGHDNITVVMARLIDEG